MRVRPRTDFIVIHCSATDDSLDIGAAEIRKWHLAKEWADIGYHYVIRRDGTIENGREDELTGAHVEGYNSRSLGICLVGGVDADDGNKAVNNYTDEQWNSLVVLLRTLRQKYPKAKIQGHRDFPGVKKACPCFDVGMWLPTVKIDNPAT